MQSAGHIIDSAVSDLMYNAFSVGDNTQEENHDQTSSSSCVQKRMGESSVELASINGCSRAQPMPPVFSPDSSVVTPRHGKSVQFPMSSSKPPLPTRSCELSLATVPEYVATKRRAKKPRTDSFKNLSQEVIVISDDEEVAIDLTLKL